jgi:hypothetical protein
MHSVVTCVRLHPFSTGMANLPGRHVHQNAVVAHANQAESRWR